MSSDELMKSQRNYIKKFNSVIEDNIIILGNLTHQHLILELITSIQRLVYKFNHKEIIIDCANVKHVSPLPTVPIVGIINFFKEKEGIQFRIRNLNSYLRHSNFNNPKQVSDASIGRLTNTLDKIWLFSNSDEINQLVTSFTASMRRTVVCEEGVINGVIWATNEVMDNVIQHSGIGRGFVLAQLSKSNNRLNVCIYDYGYGIYKTLSASDFKPKSAVDAISLCIKEGVTRDKKIGQGNGLWGLYNITSQNEGSLAIISAKGGVFFSKHGEIAKISNDIVILNRLNQSTTISFSLNLDKEISLKDAIHGDYVTDMFIEKIKGDFGEIIYKIADGGSGTGTRESGLRMKNELLNIYNANKTKIFIDFAKVSIISSSFADELIGKMIDEIGFYQFQSIFQIVNMNKSIQLIFEAALKKRLGNA
jgi:anti-anti-sigma regulatory factor